MARKKLSEQQEQMAFERNKAGESVPKLAEAFGVHPVTMRNTLMRLGMPARGHGGKPRIDPPKEEIEEMAREYEAGDSQKVVAKRHGMSSVVASRILERAGVVARQGTIGEKHWLWQGGRYEQDGYVFIRLRPGDPFFSMCNGKGYVLEHRLVMAQKLGRPLRVDETVHHKDLDHSNNKRRNLQLRQGKHGKGGAFRCADCGSCNVEPVSLASEVQ